MAVRAGGNRAWAAAGVCLLQVGLSGCEVSFLVVGDQASDAAAPTDTGLAADAGTGGDAGTRPGQDVGIGGLIRDPTFGTQGVLVLDGKGGRSVDFTPQGMALQADRLVVGGSVVSDGGLDFLVVRFEEPGTPDPTFGVGGRVELDLGTADDVLEAVAVQPDGKILLAGTVGISGSEAGAVVRLLPDGALDPGFGANGRLLVDQAPGRDVVNGLALLSDGRIRLGGQCWASVEAGTWSDLCVWGLTGTGAVDPSFNGGSYVGLDFATGDEFGGALVAVAGDRLLVPGATWRTGGFDLALAQLDAGGAPLAFAKVATDFSQSDDVGIAVAVQADGRIVSVGQMTDAAGEGNLAAVRFQADGLLDPSFGSGGRLVVDLGGQDSATAVLVLADGRIVIGGQGTQTGRRDTDFALLVVRPDGTPDLRAGPEGRAYFDVAAGQDDELHALVPDSRGRWLLYGSSSHGSGNDLALMRVVP